MKKVNVGGLDWWLSYSLKIALVARLVRVFMVLVRTRLTLAISFNKTSSESSATKGNFDCLAFAAVRNIATWEVEDWSSFALFSASRMTISLTPSEDRVSVGAEAGGLWGTSGSESEPGGVEDDEGVKSSSEEGGEEEQELISRVEAVRPRM